MSFSEADAVDGGSIFESGKILCHEIDESCSRFDGCPCHVRGDVTILRGEIRMVRTHGLDIENVDACTAELACVQCFGERFLLDDAAACGIDDDCSGFHECNGLAVCQMHRFLRQGTMEGEIIAFAEERLLVNEFHAMEALRTTHGGDHTHAESECDLCHCFADGSEAEDAEGLSCELTCGEGKIGEGLGICPIAFCHAHSVVIRTGSKMQNKRKGVLRHRIGGIAGHVANGDAAFFCGFDIDIVIARCKETDVTKLGYYRLNYIEGG